MKLIILTLFLLSSIACGASTSSASKAEMPTVEPTQSFKTDNGNDSNTWKMPPDEPVDNANLERLDRENAPFKIAPDEFKNIDFKNFKYPNVRLKDGEYEKLDLRHAGGTSYALNEVFYVDLNDDHRKEAIVIIGVVNCGGSCDGGRQLIYFYSLEKGKPKFIDIFETGSGAGGCSLKSFFIEDKKISVEQFGRCVKKTSIDENKNYSCKFCVKDLTRTIYSFVNGRLKKERSEVVGTSETNIMNYQTKIRIAE